MVLLWFVYISLLLYQRDSDVAISNILIHIIITTMRRPDREMSIINPSVIVFGREVFLIHGRPVYSDFPQSNFFVCADISKTNTKHSIKVRKSFFHSSTSPIVNDSGCFPLKFLK